MKFRELLKIAYFGEVFVKYKSHEFRILLEKEEDVEGTSILLSQEFLNSKIEKIGADEDVLLVVLEENDSE